MLLSKIRKPAANLSSSWVVLNLTPTYYNIYSWRRSTNLRQIMHDDNGHQYSLMSFITNIASFIQSWLVKLSSGSTTSHSTSYIWNTLQSSSTTCFNSDFRHVFQNSTNPIPHSVFHTPISLDQWEVSQIFTSSFATLAVFMYRPKSSGPRHSTQHHRKCKETASFGS